MSIVTRTGDDGSTGLYGSPRVSKASTRIAAYGDVDELNALLGLFMAEEVTRPPVRALCERAQQVLFRLGSDLATPQASGVPAKRIEEPHLREIEEWIRTYEPGLPPQQAFLVPSGSRAACVLHVARTICRRAERSMVALHEEEPINPDALRYVNRFSDALFIASRLQNLADGRTETAVSYD